MRALIRYTVKADQLQTHLDLLRAVHQELSVSQPEGFRWATYETDQPRHFVEIVAGAELPGPLPQLASFQRYRVGLDARCEGPREFTELHEISSFGHPLEDPGASNR